MTTSHWGCHTGASPLREVLPPRIDQVDGNKQELTKAEDPPLSSGGSAALGPMGFEPGLPWDHSPTVKLHWLIGLLKCLPNPAPRERERPK